MIEETVKVRSARIKLKIFCLRLAFITKPTVQDPRTEFGI